MTAITRRQIRARAIEVFGSRADAEKWLKEPAMALEQRAPAALLGTSQGRQLVCNLLIQLEYGVYV